MLSVGSFIWRSVLSQISSRSARLFLLSLNPTLPKLQMMDEVERYAASWDLGQRTDEFRATAAQLLLRGVFYFMLSVAIVVLIVAMKKRGADLNTILWLSVIGVGFMLIFSVHRFYALHRPDGLVLDCRGLSSSGATTSTSRLCGHSRLSASRC